VGSPGQPRELCQRVVSSNENSRPSVVEDTPTCCAALSDQELGRNLMILGAAAIGLPLRAATRRKPGAQPTIPPNAFPAADDG
jgi:hypothetical protein